MRPGFYRHHLISFVGVVVDHFPFTFSRTRMDQLLAVLVDETADQASKRLMLGSGFASAQKVSEVDLRHRSAGGHVGFVQDETAAVAVVSGGASPLIKVKISGPHGGGQYLRRALSACFLDFGHYHCCVDFRLCLFAR
jgi:hypothetical protein